MTTTNAASKLHPAHLTTTQAEDTQTDRERRISRGAPASQPAGLPGKLVVVEDDLKRRALVVRRTPCSDTCTWTAAGGEAVRGHHEHKETCEHNSPLWTWPAKQHRPLCSTFVWHVSNNNNPNNNITAPWPKSIFPPTLWGLHHFIMLWCIKPW